MVAPGFLANTEVRRWLGGVEPAWTMLEFDSFNALPWEFLRSPPSAAMPDSGHNWRVRRSGRGQTYTVAVPDVYLTLFGSIS